MNEAGPTTSFGKRVLVVVAITAFAVILLAGAAWLIQGLFILFAGVLFGNFLVQLSRLVARGTGLSYGLSLTSVVILLLAIVGGTLFFMGSQITSQISAFSQQFRGASEEFRERLSRQGWLNLLPTGGGDSPQSPADRSAPPEQQQQQQQQSSNPQPSSPGTSAEQSQLAPSQPPSWLPRGILTTAGSALLTTFSALGSAILIIFLGFYFAAAPETYRDGLVRLFPVPSRERVRKLFHQTMRTLWWWILGRMAGMAVIGVGSSVGLWLLGIPLPITLGVIAGLLNFVPNLGPLIASIPPLLFALQQGPEKAVYVGAFYVALQFVESYLLTPLIDQQQINLPPALVLSAQLLFGILAGFLGLLLATPITAVIVILVREIYIKDLLEGVH